MDSDARRHLPVLLHRLLLRAAPGDAGLSPRVTGGNDGRAVGERQQEGAATDLRAREGALSMSRLPRVLLLLASALLALMLATPLWRIQLIAPQYPEGLGMEIRAQ